MDLRKPFFFEHFFSALCSKRRVVSGFGVGLFASLLVLFLLGSVNTPSTTTSTPSSFFSWFFYGNSTKVSLFKDLDGDAKNASGLGNIHKGNSSKSDLSGEELDLGIAYFRNLTARASNSSSLVNEGSVLENTHEGKSSKDFSGKDLDLGSTHFKNLTVHASNSSGLVNEGLVLENTHEGNSSKSDFSGKDLDLGSTHFKNLTVHASNSSSLVNEGSVLENAHEGNSSKSDFSKETKDFETTRFKNLTVDAKNASSFVNAGSVLDIAQQGNASKKKDGVETSITNGSSSMEAIRQVPVKCNIFNGRWVRDEKKPHYPGGSCPHIDDDFNCHKNGRPDAEFLKWRWQPNDCDIPRLNATDFLARLNGKRILFVGDSLNRNMWESLVCILRQSVERKNKVYEVSGRHDFKTKGYYSFRFEEYNCSVDYVRSPFLVRELYHKSANGSEDDKLRLDLLDETTLAYKEADIIVFNTGHWWTHEKTSSGIEYYQEGDHVYPVLKVMEAYKKAIATWARWVDKNINTRKTQVVFRGYSLTHFRGGQWNSGGQCHKETEPIYNETFLAKYPPKMTTLEGVLGQMKTPVIYLNISRLTDYRKDGHPSIYRKKYSTSEEKIAAEKFQDCSHWCLPGVPDTWNELLYASLLIEGKGSWK